MFDQTKGKGTGMTGNLSNYSELFFDRPRGTKAQRDISCKPTFQPVLRAYMKFASRRRYENTNGRLVDTLVNHFLQFRLPR